MGRKVGLITVELMSVLAVDGISGKIRLLASTGLIKDSQPAEACSG